MSHVTDTVVRQLRAALDTLWDELTPGQVRDLMRTAPEVIDICQHNHRLRTEVLP